MPTTSTDMPFEQFIILPYKKGKGGKLVAGERRPTPTEAGAIRTATAMSMRFAGVLAVAVMVDPESGEMHEPRELVRFGEVPDLDA